MTNDPYAYSRSLWSPLHMHFPGSLFGIFSLGILQPWIKTPTRIGRNGARLSVTASSFRVCWGKGWGWGGGAY